MAVSSPGSRTGGSPVSVPAADAAWAALERCQLCELRCGINRRAGLRGPCRLGDQTHLFRLYVSYAEELDLSPALMVYLSGCNFRCAFCTQAPRCFRPLGGAPLTAPESLERIQALSAGVRWINLVGGEPSLHPHALIELRQHISTTAKWLLNTNGYFTPECLRLLDPIVDLHLIDFKFGTDACAEKLAGVPRYLEVLQRNLADVYSAGPERLVVRHLLMPGHGQCCFEPVARWVSQYLPNVRFHLMSSYVPNYRSLRTPAMSRTVSVDQVRQAEDLCRLVNLRQVE